jgi:hypothetical protein
MQDNPTVVPKQHVLGRVTSAIADGSSGRMDAVIQVEEDKVSVPKRTPSSVDAVSDAVVISLA